MKKSSIEHYVGVFRATAELLRGLGNPALAEKFDTEAEELSKISTWRELKELQGKVRLHLKGSSGALTDVMAMNNNGTLTTEGIAHHQYLVGELRKFTRHEVRD